MQKQEWSGYSIDTVRPQSFDKDFKKYLSEQEELANNKLFEDAKPMHGNVKKSVISHVLANVFWNTFASFERSGYKDKGTSMLDATVDYIKRHQLTINYRVFYQSLFCSSSEFFVATKLFDYHKENQAFVYGVLLAKLRDHLSYDVNTAKDQHGRNLLVVLLENDLTPEVIRPLLMFGADPNAIVKNKYAFQYILPAKFGFLDMLKLFSEYGAQLHIKHYFLPDKGTCYFIGDHLVTTMLELTDKLIESITNGHSGHNLPGSYILPLSQGKEFLMQLTASAKATQEVEQLADGKRRLSIL